MSAPVPAEEIALVERGPDPPIPVLSLPVSTTIIKSTKEKSKKKLRKYNRTPCTFFQVITCGSLVLLIILACVVYETWINTGRGAPQPHSRDDEKYHRGLVDRINRGNLGWKAEYNRFASRNSEDDEGEKGAAATEAAEIQMMREKTGKEFMMQDTRRHVRELINTTISLPSSFDSRTAWPHCWAVHQVYNQAGCGSCWSVAATSVMSDRQCISSNGSSQPQISALDLTSCCHMCGGCQGTHWALSAFTYWKEHGIVTGGSFGSHEGCRPYSFEPNCGTPCSSTQYSKHRTPQCERRCTGSYSKRYEDDRSKSSQAYWIRAFHGSAEFTPVKSILDSLIPTHEDYVNAIQKELFLHGPVLACFTLHEDFQHYKSGIYSADEERSEQLYGHCAKLLGWGEEGGERYWLYSNTWGRDWGENGFFRISFDEIPEEVVAGLI